MVSLSDGGLASLDGGVVGTLRSSAGVHGLGVGLKLSSNRGGTIVDSLADDNNFLELLDSEAEPVTDLGIELLLALEGVGDVKQGAGGGDNNTVLSKLLNSGLDLLDGSLEVGLPDVTTIDNTSRQSLVGAKGSKNGIELLRVTDQVDVDSIHILDGGENINVVHNITEVGGDGDLRGGSTEVADLLIGGLESSLDLGGDIQDEDRLVNLDLLGTSSLELLQKVGVDRQKTLEQINGVNILATVGLGESQEGDRSDKDRDSLDTKLKGLLEFGNGLGVGVQLELLVLLQSGLDNVVVGVKPLNHLQGGNIDTILLVTTAHSEVLIKGVQVVLAVALGDSTEELVVVQELIVESKVVGGDVLKSTGLLQLPVLSTQTLTLSKEVIAGDLATPVSLSGLLQVTELTQTGETQNGARRQSDK